MTMGVFSERPKMFGPCGLGLTTATFNTLTGPHASAADCCGSQCDGGWEFPRWVHLLLDAWEGDPEAARVAIAPDHPEIAEPMAGR
jgi:hypothetical protein